MEDIKTIIALLEKIVELFGPTITVMAVIVFIYFRYLKKGGILLVSHNNNGNGKAKNESNILNPLCDARLKFCEEKFVVIKTRLDDSDKCFEEQAKIINDTHTNVAILLERTEHLRR